MVEAGLMLGLSKCHFLEKDVVVLGYQVLAEGY
jgi:hypothetical protein